MAATAFGITVGEYLAKWDFRPRRSDKGEWTASQTFQMLRGSWENGVSVQFPKGASIVALAPHINSFYSFLRLESYEISHLAGGKVDVLCEFSGFKEDEEEELEVSYSLSASLIELPILQHPLYLKEVANNDDVDKIDVANIAAGYETGVWQISPTIAPTNNLVIFDFVPDNKEPSWLVDDPAVIPWVRMIFEDGVRTFKGPTLQWTMDRTNLGGLTDLELDRFGLVQFQGNDRPPGNPPQPFHGFRQWMLISAHDNRSTSGTSSNTLSWELSPPGGFPRFKDQVEGGRGLYNYEPSELDVQ